MYGSPPAVPRDLNRPFPPPMSSGLLRYRSAPSTVLGEACDDFVPVRPSSPDTLFARLLFPDLRDEVRAAKPPPPPPPASSDDVSQMIYQQQQNQIQQQQQQQQQHQMAMGSNLIRQSSSPAGLFSHLNNNADSGYGTVMRGIAGIRNGNNNNEGSCRLRSQLSFSSSRQSSSLLSQISEIDTESIGGYPMDSWEETTLLSNTDFPSSLKRPRDSTQPDPPQQIGGEGRNGLAHQFSLPKTSSDMAAIEKFLQFQDSVPCKIRAKRGCATHPRSIAERVRRTRISERMRKLQELVPNMDKQTNTADMLDLAVDYIKDLQKQVNSLSESRAKCTCSGNQPKPYTKV